MQIIFEITKAETSPGAVITPTYVLGVQAQITTPLEAEFLMKGIEALRDIIKERIVPVDLLASVGGVIRVKDPNSFRKAEPDNPDPPPPTADPVGMAEESPEIVTLNAVGADVIRAQIRWLKEQNRKTPTWGAAVGARVEYIKELESELQRRNEYLEEEEMPF